MIEIFTKTSRYKSDPDETHILFATRVEEGETKMFDAYAKMLCGITFQPDGKKDRFERVEKIEFLPNSLCKKCAARAPQFAKGK
jgi:hypothetical protein